MRLASRVTTIIINTPTESMPWDDVEDCFELARGSDTNLCARWLPEMQGPPDPMLVAIGQTED